MALAGMNWHNDVARVGAVGRRESTLFGTNWHRLAGAWHGDEVAKWRSGGISSVILAEILARGKQEIGAVIHLFWTGNALRVSESDC